MGSVGVFCRLDEGPAPFWAAGSSDQRSCLPSSSSCAPSVNRSTRKTCGDSATSRLPRRYSMGERLTSRRAKNDINKFGSDSQAENWRP